MNHAHLPRTLAIGLILLVAGTFTIGILHTFTPARAVANATLTPSVTMTLEDPVVAQSTETIPSESHLRTPTPLPASAYGDTTGITALGILVVMVMLVGIVWGGGFRQNSKPDK